MRYSTQVAQTIRGKKLFLVVAQQRLKRPRKEDPSIRFIPNEARNPSFFFRPTLQNTEGFLASLGVYD